MQIKVVMSVPKVKGQSVVNLKYLRINVGETIRKIKSIDT